MPKILTPVWEEVLVIMSRCDQKETTLKEFRSLDDAPKRRPSHTNKRK